MFTDALGRKQQNVELIVLIQDNYETQMTITYNKSPDNSGLTLGIRLKWAGKNNNKKPVIYLCGNNQTGKCALSPS